MNLIIFVQHYECWLSKGHLTWCNVYVLYTLHHVTLTPYKLRVRGDLYMYIYIIYMNKNLSVKRHTIYIWIYTYVCKLRATGVGQYSLQWRNIHASLQSAWIKCNVIIFLFSPLLWNLAKFILFYKFISNVALRNWDWCYIIWMVFWYILIIFGTEFWMLNIYRPLYKVQLIYLCLRVRGILYIYIYLCVYIYYQYSASD